VAISIHYSPANDNALSERFPRMLKRKVSIIGMNARMPKDWPGDFRESIREID
jgi:hypothetical protein